MYEKLRLYLYEKAPHIAAQALEAMSDAKRLSLLMTEERSDSISMIQRVIIELANTIVSGDTSNLVAVARNNARYRLEQGIPLDYAWERTRLMRGQLIQACHSFFLDGFREEMEPRNDQKLKVELELLIYRYVDAYLEAFTQAYLDSEDSDIPDGRFQISGSFRISEAAERAIVEMIFHSSDIGLLLLDRDLRIRDANQALADILLIQKDEMIGITIEELLGPRPEERFFEWATERGVAGHYVANYHGKWITFTIRPLYLDLDRWGAIAVFRSVTQSKQFEEELTKREALASIGQLAAGIAHEIRNPLTSVKGFIHLLREQVQTEQSTLYFSVIQTEIERMEGLVNDVLVLARFRDDNLTAESFCICCEVQSVVRLLEPEANKRGICLQYTFERENIWMHGFRPRIKQAVLNLCKNALEAVSGHGSQVNVLLRQQDEEILLMVEDDGPGIASEVKDNLFTPFYTTKPEGTGLGLSLTKRIVEDHHGSIQTTTSTALGGACFLVRLPCFKPNTAA